MNTQLRKNTKNDFEKIFQVDDQCSSWNNYEKCEKIWDIKPLTTKGRTNLLVVEPKYLSTIFFSDILAIEMRSTQILRNKSVHLGLYQ